MRLNPMATGLLLIAAGVIVAGVYVLDTEKRKRVADTATAPMTGSSRPVAYPPPTSPALRPPVDSVRLQPREQTTNAAPHPELPSSHPPIAVAPPGASARQGRVQVDPERAFTHFRVGNNSVIAIHADGKVVWLGTSGGIVRYETNTHDFKTVDGRDGLRANGILFLGKLRGKISVGTYGGGLSLFDPETSEWEHFGISEGLGDVFVYDVLEASSGDVWIATGSGINRVRGGALRNREKWDRYTAENTGGGLPNNRVYRLAEGKNGGIWIATRGGLAYSRNGKWEHWTHAKGLGARETPEMRGSGAKAVFNPDHVAALEVDKDGTVWAGTRGAGLARFDGTAWKNYTIADGLPSQQIATLNFDRSGRLWVGTSNGLAVLRDGKFQVMTMAHGLLGESVLSVTTTNDGDIWVGGFGGVAHIRRPSLDEQPAGRQHATSSSK